MKNARRRYLKTKKQSSNTIIKNVKSNQTNYTNHRVKSLSNYDQKKIVTKSEFIYIYNAKSKKENVHQIIGSLCFQKTRQIRKMLRYLTKLINLKKGKNICLFFIFRKNN